MSGDKRDRDPWKRPADDIADGFEQLARGVGEAVEEVGGLVGEIADSLSWRHRRSPDARLLRKAAKKEKGWRNHLRAYVVIIPCFMVLNAMAIFTQAPFFPWSVVLAVFWGAGLALHGLAHRSWTRDNAERLQRARLGLQTDSGDAEKKPVAPISSTPEPEGFMPAEVAADPVWAGLLIRCRKAVQATQGALEDSSAPEVGTDDVAASLEVGLSDMLRLATGAVRLERALVAVVPGGQAAIDAQLLEVQGRIDATADDGLRQMYGANLALLRARKAKVNALTAERERMQARAEGFLLAVENLRLDATRLGTDPSPTPDLSGPLAELSSEVEILRQVEAELASFEIDS